MDQVHVIRHKALVEEKSARQVAGEMGVSRNTVKKYLTLSEPRRNERNPRPRPIFAQVKDRIDELLEEWRLRITPKQCITGTRIHRQLRTEGFKVGITVVRDYLRQRRQRALEVSVPLLERMRR
jgi:transposase